MNEELKEPKKNIIKRLIDLLINFFSIESKKKKKLLKLTIFTQCGKN